MAETKLTTVKIILQKLVNRSVDKYIEDEVFRSEINDYQNLHESGSQF
jgi:hypothetical protein